MTVGKSKTPLWLKPYLREEDWGPISQSVARAEKSTTGEIIPMVVRQSTGTRHVALALALILFSGLLIFDLEPWLYDYHESYVWSLPGFFVLSYLVGVGLAKIPFLTRFFIANKDMIQDVYQRAELEFYRGRFDKTESQTGILIFISLLERRVVVFADQGISLRVPADTWTEIVQIVIADLKKKDLKSGLIKAIEKCGQILSKEFPATGDNMNELSNQLVVKE